MALIADAAARIEQQVAASAVWLEIDEDSGGPMDDLLARVSSDVAAGRYAAVVSTTAALIDPIHGSIAASDIDLLIDAGDAERAAALAIATSRSSEHLRLSDVATDNSRVRLRQLSDEVQPHRRHPRAFVVITPNSGDPVRRLSGRGSSAGRPRERAVGNPRAAPARPLLR